MELVKQTDFGVRRVPISPLVTQEATALTADYTIPAKQEKAGLTMTNTGAAAPVEITLPSSPAIGERYRIVKLVDQDITVVCGNADHMIAVVGDTTPAEVATHNSILNDTNETASLDLEYVETNQWVGHGVGTWVTAAV